MLTSEINRLRVKSTKKFYTKFFLKIVSCGDRYITSDEPASAIQVLKELCTVLIGVQNQKSGEYLLSVNNARHISERELAGLQYLGGYILRNVFFSMKKSTNAANRDKMKVSMADVKSLKNEEKPSNQKLVSALDRDGL